LLRLRKGRGEDNYLNNELFAIILTGQKQRSSRAFDVSRKETWLEKEERKKKLLSYIYFIHA